MKQQNAPALDRQTEAFKGDSKMVKRLDVSTIETLMLVLHQARREREYRGQHAEHLQRLHEQLADALRVDRVAA